MIQQLDREREGKRGKKKAFPRILHAVLHASCTFSCIRVANENITCMHTHTPTRHRVEKTAARGGGSCGLLRAAPWLRVLGEAAAAPCNSSHKPTKGCAKHCKTVSKSFSSGKTPSGKGGGVRNAPFPFPARLRCFG